MRPRRKKEWFDDDSFWREMYPFMFPEKRFAETEEQAEQMLALAMPAGKAVLDLCCGPGRFCVALARRGYRVTGVDRTPFLLNKARAKAKAARARIEWVRRDMRDFVRPEAFDLVLSMFTSFGYFDRKEEDVTVLKNMHASLRAGGKVVIELLGKECLARIFLPTVSSTLQDGPTLYQHHEIFDDWTRIRNEWVLLRKGRAKRFVFHHTVYSGQELRDRLELAGFTDVRLHGSLSGEAYGPNASRLVAIAEKPEVRARRTKAGA